MDKKKIVLIILALSLIILFPAASFANTYEYNDIQVYVSNVYRGTAALKSDTVFNSGDWTFFDVVQNLSDGHVYICMEGGQPVDTGVTVQGISQLAAGDVYTSIRFIQSGNMGNVSGQSASNIWRVSYQYTDYNIVLKINVNATAVKLSTPTVTAGTNVITWNSVANASGYNIQYRENESGSYRTLVNNHQGTSFDIYMSGYYSVQAAASSTGSYLNSDWSTGVSVTYDESQDTSSNGVIGWLIARISSFTSSITQFFGNIRALVSTMGETFTGLTSFLPEEYAAPVWAIAGLFLAFGLFRLIF